MDSLLTADGDPWNLDTKGTGVAPTQDIDSNITTTNNISNDVDADDNSTNNATISFPLSNDISNINNNTSNGAAGDSLATTIILTTAPVMILKLILLEWHLQWI